MKAITKTIKATSRISTKIKDTYYTVEYTEERDIPDIDGVDIEEERAELWNTVNGEVEHQIDEIFNALH